VSEHPQGIDDVKTEDVLLCPRCGNGACCALDVPYERDGLPRVEVVYLCATCDRDDPAAAGVLMLFDVHTRDLIPASEALAVDRLNVWQKTLSERLTRQGPWHAVVDIPPLE
jgi:hypothetical protein